MAEIVLGLGTSHGPMLHTPPEQWGLRVEADKASKALCYKGKLYDFPTLVSLRKPGFGQEMQLEEQKRRLARCRAAIAALAARYAATKVDLAVIVGNDQRELFLGHPLERLLARAGLDHSVPEAVQDRGERHQVGRVVVDDKDARRRITRFIEICDHVCSPQRTRHSPG